MHKLILVIDDEAAIRELVVTLINDEENFKAVGAESALKGLELIKGVNFNLIILDLQMPVMDGNQFLLELTKMNQELPVVVLSANLKNLKPHSQVKSTLAKPFDLDQLINALEKYAA